MGIGLDWCAGVGGHAWLGEQDDRNGQETPVSLQGLQGLAGLQNVWQIALEQDTGLLPARQVQSISEGGIRTLGDLYDTIPRSLGMEAEQTDILSIIRSDAYLVARPRLLGAIHQPPHSNAVDNR